MFDPTELTDSPRTPPRQIRKSRETLAREAMQRMEMAMMAKHDKLTIEYQQRMAERKAMETEDRYTEDEWLESMIE
jgi:hypothetical protein